MSAVGLPAPAAAVRTRWVVEPFLHLEPDRLHNPLTDKSLLPGEPGYRELRELLAGGGSVADLPAELAERLSGQGWLVGETPGLARRFRLKFVALETHTVCNQACYFCPVKFDPRDSYFMPVELFASLVRQLTDFRSTLEGVFLMNYNEPTVDPRFLDQCRALLAAGLPTAVNTNATGLTPKRVEALVDAGPLRFLSVNLSTLDRERYREDRGQDQLPLVLRNLDYARDRPVAREMVIAVLGQGDEQHDRDFEAIERRFAGSRFEVRRYALVDRAGYLTIGLKAARRRLGGCNNLGSRPIQHLHVTPRGKCLLCCEDYDEKYVVGDLTQSSIEEVLEGERLALMRRWAYGLEEAPAGFICRKCSFSLSR
jgi:MoaA/NifB/PqqE/SkfB family radical SAM enzyme